MTNQEICIVLNQYQYRNRTNWKATDPNQLSLPERFLGVSHSYKVEFISLGEFLPDRLRLDEFGALAICEKLVKQSSDEDIKVIVLSITQPLKDRIVELEKQLNNISSLCLDPLHCDSRNFRIDSIEVKE